MNKKELYKAAGRAGRQWLRDNGLTIGDLVENPELFPVSVRSLQYLWTGEYGERVAGPILDLCGLKILYTYSTEAETIKFLTVSELCKHIYDLVIADMKVKDMVPHDIVKKTKTYPLTRAVIRYLKEGTAGEESRSEAAHLFGAECGYLLEEK